MPIELKDQRIGVAVDSVIFTIKDGRLMVLLIKMKKKPYFDTWAFPGGLIEQNETTEHAARRILKEQTGVADVYLEQLGTFDEPKRDKAARVVSVAYFALVPEAELELLVNDKYEEARLWTVDRLPKFAYDHESMAETAILRLRAKLEYTNIAWSLLPEDFTLTKLQQTYESIMGRPLDKRNFRRKILSLGLIKPTGSKQSGGKHRPAQLYHFKDRKLVYMDIL
ncbi:MAG: NUDIX domain-containing protein [Patescibacteria group bacterium]